MKSFGKILIVIQARSGSSRLPGKIFLPLSGKPLLLRIYERVAASKIPKQIVIATTNEQPDDEVCNLCREYGINYFRGNSTDLLDRHYRAAVEFHADEIVKIPSDCPLICPDVIDNVLNFYFSKKNNFDFVSNLHPPTYPDGMDVEIMPFKILENAWLNAKKDFEREHTTPYIWENPAMFNIGNFEWETGLDYSASHRFTIDYPEDYEFIRKIYDELYNKSNIFNLDDIIKLLKKKPALMEINKKYLGVNWYRNHLHELKTINRQ